MRYFLYSASAMLLLAGCVAEMDDKMAAPENGAQVHMGHVMTGWNDTPDKQGLLPTAVAESKIAALHAGFAASKPTSLGWMKTHIGHVMHAVDPSVEPEGPGLGYGVIEAAEGAAKHIGFAAADENASDNVKLHAEHVGASATNVATWGKLIVRLGKKVKASNTAAFAAPIVRKIEELATRLTAGEDVNGDGKITWIGGEGGLDAAAKHMGFMQKGEGLPTS